MLVLFGAITEISGLRRTVGCSLSKVLYGPRGAFNLPVGVKGRRAIFCLEQTGASDKRGLGTTPMGQESAMHCNWKSTFEAIAFLMWPTCSSTYQPRRARWGARWEESERVQVDEFASCHRCKALKKLCCTPLSPCSVQDRKHIHPPSFLLDCGGVRKGI